MIQPLRATHRAVFFALPIVLAAVLASGLALRHHWPALQKLSTNDVAMSETRMTVARDLKVRWLRQPAPMERKLQLVPAKRLATPDLLLYWSEDSAAKALPSNAFFLGSFHADGIYTLPAEARDDGYLSLYSLAHREVVASIPLGACP